MPIENRRVPEWALRERQQDLAWIDENLEIFILASAVSYQEIGRGAIVIDTVSRPVADAGHAFGYVDQEEIELAGDENTKRLVREYEPAQQELVVMLLKPFNRTSSYRLRAQQHSAEGAANGLV